MKKTSATKAKNARKRGAARPAGGDAPPAEMSARSANSAATNSGADSIEGLTVQSLDLSIEGIGFLSETGVTCGESLLSNPEAAITQFGGFVQNLRNFYVFENDVRSLFQIDCENIRDAMGTLKDAETALSAVMSEISARLEGDDLAALATLLRKDLPAILKRFADLLPILRNHIEREYVAVAN